MSNLVVNGGFSEWGEWGECSATCDNGTISRERVCNNPEPKGAKAKDCQELGPYTEIKPCRIKHCQGQYYNSQNFGLEVWTEL